MRRAIAALGFGLVGLVALQVDATTAHPAQPRQGVVLGAKPDPVKIMRVSQKPRATAALVYDDPWTAAQQRADAPAKMDASDPWSERPFFVPRERLALDETDPWKPED